MQAAPATLVPLPYPVGMQATTTPQQQQGYPQQLLQHLQPVLVQAPAQMPAAAPQQQHEGYGAAAGLHSMPPVNNFNHSTSASLSGQKRDSSGALVHGGHDSTDGAFVKLFVGSVPRTITEDEVRPMFAEHGNVLEVAIIKDKRTGNQQDPKRPKGGDARVGGAGTGGPGFSPRQGSHGQQGPGGPRPMPAQMVHPAGRGPPMGWRPQGGAGLAHPQVGQSPYGAPALPRGGPVTGVPQMSGMMVSPMMNGHLQGPMPVSGQVATPVMLASSLQQASQGYFQQASQQRPQLQYVLQPPQQQQMQQIQQPPYVQMLSSQQPQAYMQQQVPPRPIMQVQPGQQQQPQQPQVLMQLQSQAAQQQRQLPEQVSSQPMGQLQALQPGQQQPQQQSQPGQQLQLQPMYYQVPLASQQLQQPPYYMPVQPPQPLVSVPAPQPPPLPLTCDWSEHTSPEGYKYYYNNTSGESKWEKPEELKNFEQQQQQQQGHIQLAITANPSQQQYSNPPAVQQTFQGMSYMQPQPVSNGSVEQPRQQGPPGANLFVFRIPDDFTDESMKDTFAPFGNVVSARVGVERESGRNRGFGFVSFDTAASAEAAIQGLNNVAVGGRRLKVERKRGEENGTHVYQQQQY